MIAHMRQLIRRRGKKNRGLIEEAYIGEHLYCQKCQKTVPVGIEVIIFKRDAGGKKLVKHACYCRAHGSEYSGDLD